MIFGEEDQTSSAMTDLITSTIIFYPTGSRAFNTQRLSSDWDFFTLYDSSAIQYLANRDWTPLVDNGYLDHETVLVMRKNYLNKWIDVQFIRNVDLKLNAQRLLLDRLHLRHLLKDPAARKDLWELAYKAANNSRLP